MVFLPLLSFLFCVSIMDGLELEFFPLMAGLADGVKGV